MGHLSGPPCVHADTSRAALGERAIELLLGRHCKALMPFWVTGTNQGHSFLGTS